MAKSLLQKYHEYNARLREQGTRMLTFQCPNQGCGNDIEVQAAPKGDTWDTLTTCPHCEQMFFRITHHDRVEALFPQRPTQEAGHE